MQHEEAVAAASGSWSRLPAASALRFHFVNTPEEVEAAASSPSAGIAPFFCHSVFGDAEDIAGFSKLRVDVFVSRDTNLDVLIRATGSPCASPTKDGLDRSEETTLCLREEEPAVEDLPLCFSRLRSQLLAVPYPGGVCDSHEDFVKRLLRRRCEAGADGDGPAEVAGDEENLFSEGELVGEAWLRSLNAMLQLWKFRLRSREKGPSCDKKASPFARLHRRLEWFMRFFIDGASEIEEDGRWTVYLPVKLHSPQRPPKKPLPSGCLLRQRSAALRACQQRSQPSLEKKSASAESASDARSEETREKSSLCGVHEEPRLFSKRPWGSKGDNEVSCLEAEDREEAESEKENARHASQVQRTGLGLVAFVGGDSKEKRLRAGAPAKNQETATAAFSPTKQASSATDTCTARVEALGCFTTYDFFSLNGSRRRVSQALVMPHVQGKGVGQCVLESLVAEALLDEGVGSLAVENPAPSFEQLRNASDLSVCFDAHLLPVEWLFPRKTHDSDCGASEADPDSPETRALLAAFTKEPAVQTAKLVEILLLAQVLPVDAAWAKAPHAAFSNFLGRGWREAAISPSLENSAFSSEGVDFAASALTAKVRMAVKRRLWKEAGKRVKGLASSEASKGGAFKGALSEEEKQRLDQEWLLHFFCYARTVCSLRRRYSVFANSARVSNGQNAAAD